MRLDERLAAVTPTGTDHASLHREDIVVLDTDGQLVDGLLKPTSV